jgi:ABC-2 type transport system permease protein/sodium transport system permease protein
VFLFGERIGLTLLGSERLEAAQQLLDNMPSVSLGVWLLSIAFVPAIFEELFFRGFLYSSLERTRSPRTAILVTAVLFGLFHVAAPSFLAVERLLPSMMLGVILGVVRWRSGSIFPPIALHACHNGLLVTIAFYRDALKERGIGIQQTTHMPGEWLAGAAVVVLLGFTLLMASSLRSRRRADDSAAVKPTATASND